MLYRVELTVQWDTDSYRTPHCVRAVSRKHALDKAILVARQLPCYTDRHYSGQRVNAEATLLGTDP